MSEPLSDAEVQTIREILADCGCDSNFCDSWGCGDVRRLLADRDRLAARVAELERQLAEVQKNPGE